MLGNVTCWCIALGIVFSKSSGAGDLYTKLLLAMGFIFLGILSKAVDVYHDTHSNDTNQNT